jgi:hypothetical protein
MLAANPPRELIDLSDIRVNKTGLYLRCHDSEYTSIQDDTYPFNAVTQARMPFPPGVLNPGFPKVSKVADGLYSFAVLQDSAQPSYPIFNKTGISSMTNYQFVIVMAGVLDSAAHSPLIRVTNTSPSPAQQINLIWTGSAKGLAIQTTGTVLQTASYTRTSFTLGDPYGLVLSVDTNANTRSALWYDPANGWTTLENAVALTSGDMNLFNSVSANYTYAINGKYYGLFAGAAPTVAGVIQPYANWRSTGMWMVESWIAGNKVVDPSVIR